LCSVGMSGDINKSIFIRLCLSIYRLISFGLKLFLFIQKYWGNSSNLIGCRKLWWHCIWENKSTPYCPICTITADISRTSCVL
jgi:hypothetical protein